MRTIILSVLTLLVTNCAPHLRSRTTGDDLGVSLGGTVALIQPGDPGAGQAVDFALSPLTFYVDPDCTGPGGVGIGWGKLSENATAFIGHGGSLLRVDAQRSARFAPQSAAQLTGDGRPECTPFSSQGPVDVQTVIDLGPKVKAYPWADLYVD